MKTINTIKKVLEAAARVCTSRSEQLDVTIEDALIYRQARDVFDAFAKVEDFVTDVETELAKK